MNMEDWEIFASWIDWVEHYRPHKTNQEVKDGRYVQAKWVAVRGSWYHDRAIYTSLDTNFGDLSDGNHVMVSEEIIAKLWTKLLEIPKIKELVPCDDEAFSLYRY